METPQISALIVDDEKLSRDTLQLLLERCCPEVRIAGTFADLASMEKQLDKEKVDVLFLDINIPGENVFEFLENKRPDQHIVFTTAYSNYALQAFRVNALSYLLKPIQSEELVKTVARIKTIIGSPKPETKSLELPKKIAIPDLEGFLLVNMTDIVRCEASDNYTEVVLLNGKKHMVSKTLKEFEETLAPFSFCRIHNSHLINLNHVVQYSKSGQVKMKDDSWVEISKRKKTSFLELIRTHSV